MMMIINVTKSIYKNSAREGDSLQASKQTLHDPNTHYSLHQRPSLATNMRQTNPIQSYLFKIHCSSFPIYA
jgi:hypothetical protein